MSRVGFIGTGHIAAPMVRYLAGRGHEVCVTRRSEAVSSALAKSHGVAVAEPQEVLDRSEIIVLCLRPQHVAALEPLAFRGEHRLVSVMAGVSRGDLARLCAPVTDIVQTIPLGYLERGGCPLAAYGNDALLATLFAPDNPVVKVDSEAALNAHFALFTLVPGLLDLMATGAAWLGQQTRDSSAAEFYTTQLMTGFLAAMETGGAGRLAEERDALATEGTISLQMTDALRNGGAHGALTGALDAIGARLAP